MDAKASPSLCTNCHRLIEGSGLTVNGQAYCCAGCGHGHPCVCIYSGSSALYADALALAGNRLAFARPKAGSESTDLGPAGDLVNSKLSPPVSPQEESVNPAAGPAKSPPLATPDRGEHPPVARSEPAQPDPVPADRGKRPPKTPPNQREVIVGLADAFLREAASVRQAEERLRGDDSRSKALSQLLRQVASLLQRGAEQLHGLPTQPAQQLTPPTPMAKGGGDDSMGKTWESVRLTVENIANPAMAFQYARALEGLDSVKEIMVLKVEGRTVHYQVWTTSNAKFTREILALPYYRPRRVQTSADKITVTFTPTNQEGTLEEGTGEIPDQATKGGQPVSASAPGGETLTSAASIRSARAMEVGTEAFFNARHYLTVDTKPGPIEMRTWRVELSLVGDQFDDNGALVGFDAAQSALKQILAGYNNRLLNDIEPYNRLLPTPENISRNLYGQIKASLADQPLRLKGLKVWATPTQYASYFE